MPMSEIDELKNSLVNSISPLRIYLFGSFATGTQTKDSDFDFYIVVPDSCVNIAEETAKAYKAIRRIKQRPVDILLGTLSRFEQRKSIPSVEYEVDQKGVLLYG